MNEQWTTEPPIETGLYWAYNGTGVKFLAVYKSGYGPKAFMVAFELGINHDLMRRDTTDYTHWQGPLTPPEPPNEP